MNTLVEKLDAGPVICAEGYLFELERRGYLQAGPFAPEVVLEHPEVVARLHLRFSSMRARISSEKHSPTTHTGKNFRLLAARTTWKK